MNNTNFIFRTLLHLLFVLFLLLVSRSKHQCFGLILTNNDIECRPVDIELYSWSGPGFQSGECWHHGHRFANGATWGRMEIPGSPYCVCEQGKVRIFYSQQQPTAADPLTILRPTDGTSPTSNDLAKWPIPNFPTVRQRMVNCSSNRLGIRVRSRDGCVGCKCSKNGHWLCRKPPSLNKNRTINQQSQQVSRSYPYSYLDTYHAHLRVTTSRIRSECPLGSIPKFCILIERLLSSNTSEKLSRFIEIPRETSWIDHNSCTRCSCALDGHLKCEFLRESCIHPCLLHKTRPISIMYYFPSGSKWLAPLNDKCRSCMCIDGERKCINCDQILKIDVSPNTNNNNNQQRSAAIGEYRLLPIVTKIIKATPCLLQTSTNSHRLIFPGQQTWFEQRCYFCSQRGDRLITC